MHHKEEREEVNDQGLGCWGGGDVSKENGVRAMKKCCYVILFRKNSRFILDIFRQILRKGKEIRRRRSRIRDYVRAEQQSAAPQ